MPKVLQLTCRMSEDLALLDILKKHEGELFILAVTSKFYNKLCETGKVSTSVVPTGSGFESMHICEDETRMKVVALLFWYEINGLYILTEVSSEKYEYLREERACYSRSTAETGSIIILDV